MSVEKEPLELLISAQAALRQAKEALRAPTPREFTACGVVLDNVSESLRTLRPPAKLGAARIEPAARELQRDLSEVKQLLAQAGAIYLGRFRMLESATGVYDANGELSAPAGNALSVRG